MKRKIMTYASYEPSKFSIVASNKSEFIAVHDIIVNRFGGELIDHKGFKEVIDNIDTTQQKGIILCNKNDCDHWKLCAWLSSNTELVDYVNRIQAKDLQWFLSSKYALLDGTVVNSKEEASKWLEEFTLKEFSAFLKIHRSLRRFKQNLLSDDAEIKGWCHRKDLSTPSYQEMGIEDPLEAYLSTKTWGGDIYTNHVAYAISMHSFDWGYTSEGYTFWHDLHYEWRLHASRLMMGIEPFLS